MTKKKLLNVGGGSKSIPIPPRYKDYEHVLLDIDARLNPDILLDGAKLHTLPAAAYDAVYCSHNLEHYYRHEAEQVARGMIHVLKPDGFAEVRVPDLAAVMQHVAVHRLDVDDLLYRTQQGLAILVHDTIYGYSRETAEGNEFFAHKTGFTPRSLQDLLLKAGFEIVYAASDRDHFEAFAFAFKQETGPERVEALMRGEG